MIIILLLISYVILPIFFYKSGQMDQAMKCEDWIFKNCCDKCVGVFLNQDDI